MTDLRALAEKALSPAETGFALPGLWYCEQDDDGYWSVNAKGDGSLTPLHNHITYGPLEATHAYIAAASPDVVLRLLAIEEAARALDGHHYESGRLDARGEPGDPICGECDNDWPCPRSRLDAALEVKP